MMIFPKNDFGDEILRGLWLILPINIFKIMKKYNVTFGELNSKLDEYIYSRNRIFGCTYHNGYYYLAKNDKRFKFGIFQDEFIIWDSDDKHLGSIKINNDNIPNDEFIDWLDNLILEYLEGKIHCSGCDKVILKSEIKGRFFAGIYCENCWESEYKELASKETYD